MTGGLSVFVDSSQDSLPWTAVLPMSRLEQLLLGSPLGTVNEQASEFLMSGTANDLSAVSDGSTIDSFYDNYNEIREDLFVDVNHTVAVFLSKIDCKRISD